jgi:hypothetical protein
MILQLNLVVGKNDYKDARFSQCYDIGDFSLYTFKWCPL